jgi:hypothetical protein
MFGLRPTALTGAALIVVGIFWEGIANGWKPSDMALPVWVILVGFAAAVYSLLSENLALKAHLKPRLRFGEISVREKGEKGGGSLRIFGVGVVNEGLEPASNVEVKLLKIEPEQLRAYWNTPLLVMNAPQGTTRQDVHGSGAPPAQFEFLHYSVGGKARHVCLRFGHESLFARSFTADGEKYFLTLAISGPGAERPVRFCLLRGSDGLFELRRAI